MLVIDVFSLFRRKAGTVGHDRPSGTLIGVKIGVIVGDTLHLTGEKRGQETNSNSRIHIQSPVFAFPFRTCHSGNFRSRKRIQTAEFISSPRFLPFLSEPIFGNCSSGNFRSRQRFETAQTIASPRCFTFPLRTSLQLQGRRLLT